MTTQERELRLLLHAHGYNAHEGNPEYGLPPLIGLHGIRIETPPIGSGEIERYTALADKNAEDVGDGIGTVFTRGKCGWTVSMSLESWLTLYATAGRGNSIFETSKETESNDND